MNPLHQLLLRIRPASLASFLKKHIGPPRQIRETPEGKFWIDPLSNFGQSFNLPQGYEPQLTHCIKQILKPSDTFIDLGTNEGYFSILASHLVTPTGLVLSIEPQSRLQPIIFKNIQLNQAHHIKVFQTLIADAPGTAHLHLTPDMNTGASGLTRVTRYTNPTETIPKTTLTAFLDLLAPRPIKLIKIDIEGGEYDAILSSKETFRQKRIQHIALELHPHILNPQNKNPHDITTFLKSCGYQTNPDFPNLLLSLP